MCRYSLSSVLWLPLASRLRSRILYNYFRDYDPTTGRYLQADPIGILKDFDDPQLEVAVQAGLPVQDIDLGNGLNHLYGYVDQDPLNHVDLYGLFGSIQGWENSVYPSSFNNDRFDDCYETCLDETSVLVCTAVGAGTTLASRSARAGQAVDTVCSWVTKWIHCTTKCSDDEDDECKK